MLFQNLESCAALMLLGAWVVLGVLATEAAAAVAFAYCRASLWLAYVSSLRGQE
jgi:hypothetical protein